MNKGFLSDLQQQQQHHHHTRLYRRNVKNETQRATSSISVHLSKLLHSRRSELLRLQACRTTQRTCEVE